MSTYYLTAGLLANDTGLAAGVASTYYTTAGLPPDDLPVTPPTPPTPTLAGFIHKSIIGIAIGSGVGL